MNLRNKKVYVKDEKEENFWHKHYIWAFDFYVTKKLSQHKEKLYEL